MTEPYYNNSYGVGIEGVFNYVNELTTGWFGNLFLIFIFIASFTALSKSEWKMSGVLSFSFFLVFITGMIMQLFMQINPIVIYAAVIGLAINVFVGFIAKGRQ